MQLLLVKPRSESRRHGGYVLLVTLLLVALAASAVVGASRASLQRARTALEAQEQLQRRWGTASIELTLPPLCAALLADQDKTQHTAAACCYRNLRLGDVRFELLICDEQAKLHVGRLYDQRQRRGTEEALRQLLANSVPSLKVKLRPTTRPSESSTLAASGAYSSVLDGFSPQQLIGLPAIPGEQVPPAYLITCWGDGRVNVRRAPRQVLRAVLSPALDDGSIDRLAAIRSQVDLSRSSASSAPPVPPLGQMLDQLDLTREQRQAAEACLSDGSNCYALWIVSSAGSSADDSRSEPAVKSRARRYRLVVTSGGSSAAAAPQSFEW